jgi:hypothetical protein
MAKRKAEKMPRTPLKRPSDRILGPKKPDRTMTQFELELEASRARQRKRKGRK